MFHIIPSLEGFSTFSNAIASALKPSDLSPCGSIGLIDDPKRQYDMVKMIGYAIGEAYWGKGFMSEATHKVIQYGFAELKLFAISAY